jgi:hypothetical protein
MSEWKRGKEVTEGSSEREESEGEEKKQMKRETKEKKTNQWRYRKRR